MGFFEYLAFNGVDVVLMFIGVISFLVTLFMLVIYLDSASKFDVKIIKPFVPSLIIFCSVFFIGLLFPGDSYFKEMRLRKKMGTIDIIDVNSKLDEIKIDLERVKNKVILEE